MQLARNRVMKHCFTYKHFTSAILILFYSTISFSQSIKKQFSESVSVQISNPLQTERKDVLVSIKANQLTNTEFNADAFVVMDGDKELASQYNKTDEDEKGIVFMIDALKANEKKTIIIYYNKTGKIEHNYTKRTQAELSHKVGGRFENREYIGGEFKNVNYLRVPPEHKDHSWFIRYEGPGWESDKVGYRFYLDQRNAADVFGKVKPEMALQKTGLDGFDSYHNMQDWGMDVMKVGKSVGVGSIATLYNKAALRVEKTDSVDCRITENGAIYSSILTRYFGWQVGEKKHDVSSRLSIHAGSRLSRELLTVSNNIGNITTGITKDKASKFITDKGNEKQWAYVATYGKQSLNNDNLGLAVFFNPSTINEFTEDEFSHLVSLRLDAGKVDYYFLAAWEKEPNGITNEEAFRIYITQVAQELANPVQVKMITKK
jgi:hypothetical protein